MALRDVFLERVSDKLYQYLRDGPLRGWDYDQIRDFAEATITDNEDKIDEYLKIQKVTLKNINNAVDDIVSNILIPAIEIK
jgi:hypothetical protein